ncbi:MAG: L-threonylcarbamoyladenylate synthase [Acidaminobacteraceae bacterium]
MIDTLIVKKQGNKNWLEEAARLLRENEVVAFPTETVYGLGGNALSKEAISKIYKAKGRPSDNPLIVHIAEISDLDVLVAEIPEVAKKLMDKFWPGPLTLIFKKSDKVPAQVTGGLNTVAVRMPSHAVARELIRLSGVPVAAPSANISGKPSPTSFEHVIADLSGRVAAIVCGDVSSVGLESTVVDISSKNPMILRPGGVTIEMLSKVVDNVSYDPAIINISEKDNLIPMSPGMKYRHYSPSAPLIVINCKDKDFVLVLNDLAKDLDFELSDIGVLCSKGASLELSNYVVKNVGAYNDLDEVASNLFDALRYFDTTSVKIIYAQGFPLVGIGQAIMNRLNKASGGKAINIK